MIADDRLWEDERQRFRTAAGDCHCSEGPGHASASARASRRMPDLADVFASDYRRPVSIDDPGLMVARNHISRWVSRPPVYLVGVAALAEIHVAENATLVMSPSVHVVNASTIIR